MSAQPYWPTDNSNWLNINCRLQLAEPFRPFTSKGKFVICRVLEPWEMSRWTFQFSFAWPMSWWQIRGHTRDGYGENKHRVSSFCYILYRTLLAQYTFHVTRKMSRTSWEQFVVRLRFKDVRIHSFPSIEQENLKQLQFLFQVIWYD